VLIGLWVIDMCLVSSLVEILSSMRVDHWTRVVTRSTRERDRGPTLIPTLTGPEVSRTTAAVRMRSDACYNAICSERHVRRAACDRRTDGQTVAMMNVQGVRIR